MPLMEKPIVLIMFVFLAGGGGGVVLFGYFSLLTLHYKWKCLIIINMIYDLTGQFLDF